MVKFPHTVFALPFALAAMLLPRRGLPDAATIGWILAAMVAAMAVLVVVRWRKRRRKAIESGANVQDRVDRGTS